jgi:hypothetical protein
MEVAAPTPSNRFNSAYRVFMLLSEAREQPQNVPTIAAWSNTLGVTGTDLPDEEFHTVELLHLLSSQINMAKNQMHVAAQFPEDTYTFAFDKAQETINVTALGARWEGYKNSITPDVLTTLRWCSHAIDADPIQVQEDELSTLEQELAKFKSSVKEKTKSEELKYFLLEHIALIERAFLEYKVVGARAFQRAAGNLLTSLEDPHNQEVFERNRDEPEVKQVVSIWRRMLQAGQATSMLNSAVTLVQKALEWGGPFLGNP